jgi:hypothetical protein
MDENIPNPSTPPLDGPCFFYQLSRELRDMVYEYALSVPEGVSMEISTSEARMTTIAIAIVY